LSKCSFVKVVKVVKIEREKISLQAVSHLVLGLLESYDLREDNKRKMH
jgi:hypothetical protein